MNALELSEVYLKLSDRTAAVQKVIDHLVADKDYNYESRVLQEIVNETSVKAEQLKQKLINTEIK